MAWWDLKRGSCDHFIVFCLMPSPAPGHCRGEGDTSAEKWPTGHLGNVKRLLDTEYSLSDSKLHRGTIINYCYFRTMARFGKWNFPANTTHCAPWKAKCVRDTMYWYHPDRPMINHAPEQTLRSRLGNCLSSYNILLSEVKQSECLVNRFRD